MEPVTQAYETERRCRARTEPGIEQNPRNLHRQVTSEPASMALDKGACDAGMEWRCRARTGPGIKENPRNLYEQDSEPALMAIIHSIHGQGYLVFIQFSREGPRETRLLRSQYLSILHS